MKTDSLDVWESLPDAVRAAIIKEAARELDEEKSPAERLCPSPHDGPQTRFLALHDVKEVLYGGAAGGGKSAALIMDALRYADVPGYSAVIFRRTYPQLAAEDGLIAKTKEWFPRGAAEWSEKHSKWTFPTSDPKRPATLTFSHLQYDKDVLNHQGAAYQFIGFDELTQFMKSQYRYLFSRLRRPSLTPDRQGKTHPLGAVPLRVRGATNPGGPGHDWVRARFFLDNDRPTERMYVAARITDNPSLDQKSYIETLGDLDDLERAQLLLGDWDAAGDGLIRLEDIKSCETPDALWPEGEPPPGRNRPELYLGYDVARSQDLSVLWTLERVGDRFYTRRVDILEKQPFRKQAEFLRERMTGDVVKICIDAGGIGMQLAEDLEADYPSKVERIQLTSGRQGQIAQALKIEVLGRNIALPTPHQVPELRDDFMLVRKTDTKNGVPVLSVGRGEVGHADRFWGCGLARHAAPARPQKRRARAATYRKVHSH